jgi:hypothetical protein
MYFRCVVNYIFTQQVLAYKKKIHKVIETVIDYMKSIHLHLILNRNYKCCIFIIMSKSSRFFPTILSSQGQILFITRNKPFGMSHTEEGRKEKYKAMLQ